MHDLDTYSVEAQSGSPDRIRRYKKEIFMSLNDTPRADRLHIGLFGKRNSGKSSLINKLLGENRVIVSPIAGTTRDSIDTPFEKDGEKYLLIDTAGIRRKSKVNENIEKFSVIRAVAAIERCDVCLLMIDAQEGITEQDKKIAGIAHEAGKGVGMASRVSTTGQRKHHSACQHARQNSQHERAGRGRTAKFVYRRHAKRPRIARRIPQICRQSAHARLRLAISLEISP